ncbi:hypothetical protein MTO96_034198 [Rhipicephalus appendiculatus]
MAANPNEPAIGIDLGTTYSRVGIFQHGKVDIIANDQGNRTTPSYVTFSETERLIGDPAKAQGPLNPENTVFDPKRHIGRTFDDPKLQDDLKRLPFTVMNDNTPEIKVTYKGEQIFIVEEISAMILTKVREIAEAYFRQITLACVTVPAYFNDLQREATKDACTIAGLQALKMLNEPTAAALAYGLEKCLRWWETLASGVRTSKAGLVDHFIKEIKLKLDTDISDIAGAVPRLRTATERAKRILSSTTETSIEIDGLFDGTDFYTKITRARFEELCLDLFKSILRPIQRALDDSETDKKVDDVVLVGGSTRILPESRRSSRSSSTTKELCFNINPDEAIACGAAVSACPVERHQGRDHQRRQASGRGAVVLRHRDGRVASWPRSSAATPRCRARLPSRLRRSPTTRP